MMSVVEHYRKRGGKEEEAYWGKEEREKGG